MSTRSKRQKQMIIISSLSLGADSVVNQNTWNSLCVGACARVSGRPLCPSRGSRTCASCTASCASSQSLSWFSRPTLTPDLRAEGGKWANPETPIPAGNQWQGGWSTSFCSFHLRQWPRICDLCWLVACLRRHIPTVHAHTWKSGRTTFRADSEGVTQKDGWHSSWTPESNDERKLVHADMLGCVILLPEELLCYISRMWRELAVLTTATLT